MASNSEYDSSRLDLPRLLRYAQKVATVTTRERRAPITYVVRENITAPAMVTTEHFFGLVRREKQVQVRRDVDRHVKAVGAHWLLDERQWQRRELSVVAGTKVEEKLSERHYTVLVPDGRVMRLVISETEVTNVNAAGRYWLAHRDSSHSLREAETGDVLLLDYKKQWRRQTSRYGGAQIFSQGNREQGRVLAHHAKGVGLSLALRRLADA